MVDLLELSLISLLACLSNDPKSINSYPVSRTLAIDNEDNQTCNVLELHETQRDIRSTGGVPITFSKSDDLGRRDIFCFLKSQNVRTVVVDLEGLWSHRDFVVILGSRRERGNLAQCQHLHIIVAYDTYLESVNLEQRLERQIHHKLLICITFHPVLLLRRGLPLE